MNDKQIEDRNELFDSAMREQFTDYEPKVPHALWNRISSELDKGEASDESAVIPESHRSGFGKWKLAIAAAVLLTLTVGTLLYTLNPNNGTNITSTPIANKVNNTASQPAVAAPVQVTETKIIASASVIKKAINTTPVQHSASESAIAKAKESVVTETIPAKQEQMAQDLLLEFAPVSTENKPIEVGNIPLASLNFLSTPSSLNDEITVIKSTEKKKKHGRKEDESTKVILIGKKFDSKPDIRYQVPVRF